VRFNGSQRRRDWEIPGFLIYSGKRVVSSFIITYEQFKGYSERKRNERVSRRNGKGSVLFDGRK
jgi:hypothetical protein